MCFMQIESVLQTKKRSELAKNRFSVALDCADAQADLRLFCTHMTNRLFHDETHKILLQGAAG